MGFQRARSEEQKRIRLQQILTVANDLLNQYAYKDISLDRIAEGLHFSRANIARYASTKEEIFLILYVNDMQDMCQELIHKCQASDQWSIGEFATLFADICVQHTNFMRLGAILNTIIEENIKAERLAHYKKIMLLQIEDIILLLCQQFPFLSGEAAYEMVMILIGYMTGLYPSAHLSPVQKEALLLTGMNHCEQDFYSALVRFITILLSGYQALA